MRNNAFFIFSIFAALNFSIAGEIQVNPNFTGRVIETDSKIIVEGGTIVANGGNDAAIKLNKGSNKEVIISNVRVISNNQNVRNTTGHAGIVDIDNSTSTARVTVRNVNVSSRNAKITTEVQGKDACAGVVCIDSGSHDTARSVEVRAAGQTTISATSGAARPDYRKMK
ncbi:MAG: hypothetical protein RIR79_1675 [Pseudomonadota bacterium]|jgi:hypothetical protein